MSTLLRRPLTWIVAGEVAIVTALVLAAWHVYESRSATPPVSATLHQPSRPQSPPPLPTTRPPLASASPGVSRSSPLPSPSGRPGLATDDAFLARQADALNRDQAAWERMQWSLVRTAIEQGRRYLDAVVVPAVVQARKRQDGSPAP
jgi:hypothetical protein